MSFDNQSFISTVVSNRLISFFCLTQKSFVIFSKIKNMNQWSIQNIKKCQTFFGILYCLSYFNSVHAFLFFYSFFASLFPVVKGFFHLSISVGCASRTVAFLWPSRQLYQFEYLLLKISWSQRNLCNIDIFIF